MTSQGVLIIEARQYRSQEQNRQAALERLVRLIQQASEAPKPRSADQTHTRRQLTPAGIQAKTGRDQAHAQGQRV